MSESQGYKLDENGNPVKVEDTGKPKAKAKAKAAPKAKKEPKAEGEKGAPRPRKYDYGFDLANKVSVVDAKAEVKLKAKENEGYEIARKGCTVHEFFENSDRGILRRLCRKGLVKVTAKDGTVYPKPYEKPADEPGAGDKAE